MHCMERYFLSVFKLFFFFRPAAFVLDVELPELYPELSIGPGFTSSSTLIGIWSACGRARL